MTANSAFAPGVRPNFRQRYDQLPELRPLPVVATRLMQACQDPKSDSKTVARIIECDPGVALKLMKVANSAMYGCSGRVKTVDQAIVLLGFRAVRDLAISVAGAQVFQNGSTAMDERMGLWRHSLACATVARLLARTFRTAVPEEAFLAGVFHDVGKLMFYDLDAAEYIRLQKDCPQGATVVEEQREFGITHTEIGLECGDDWGLPEPVRMAIGFHHAPSESPEHRSLVSLLQTANHLAKVWCLTGDREATATAPPQLDMPLDEAVLEPLKAQASQEYGEVRAICGG